MIKKWSRLPKLKLFRPSQSQSASFLPSVSTMGFYIKLTPEAQLRLERERRLSTILSLSIGILTCILVALIAKIIMIRTSKEDFPVFTASYSAAQDSYEPSEEKAERVDIPPLSDSSQNVLAAISLDSTSVAISSANSEFPEIEQEIGSVSADDFGSAPAQELKEDEGALFFGSSNLIKGSLTGRLYDFKQTKEREPNARYLDSLTEENGGTAYADIVNSLHKRKFTQTALNGYYKAPKELSLTHLAIPFVSAAEGPRYFGAEKEMQPSGWVAHYSGFITAPEDGRYRFAGISDDYMVVFLNGAPRLIACWPSLQPQVIDRWKPAEDSDKWVTPIGEKKLIYGDWVTMKAGQQIKMDLGIGERPGGYVGFLLLIEKEGAEYRKAKDGRPILPLFTTTIFSEKTQKEVTSKFPTFEFEWEKLSVFKAQYLDGGQ